MEYLLSTSHHFFLKGKEVGALLVPPAPPLLYTYAPVHGTLQHLNFQSSLPERSCFCILSCCLHCVRIPFPSNDLRRRHHGLRCPRPQRRAVHDGPAAPDLRRRLQGAHHGQQGQDKECAGMTLNETFFRHVLLLSILLLQVFVLLLLCLQRTLIVVVCIFLLLMSLLLPLLPLCMLLQLLLLLLLLLLK